MAGDFRLVFQWWATLFLIGAAAYPLTRRLGLPYLFSKAIGLAVVTFLVYIGGVLHVVPFTQGAVWGAMAIMFVLGVLSKHQKKPSVFLVEELFFFAALLFWSWVKAHEPSIHGLEKFMDFGFTQSILNSTFFPAPDMWYAGHPINYYYFGHTVMAVVTKLSGIDLTVTFNLMLATLFALTASMSFSIGKQLTGKVWGGGLTAFLATLAGNMQTLYAFTPGYEGDNVIPFWRLGLSVPDGLKSYWYANATRFIPFTIHEFPSYSFVVSDVHGHVLSLPFVLLAIGLLIRIWTDKKVGTLLLIFYGFLCGVLLATNALDGPMYFGLLAIVLWVKKDTWKQLVQHTVIVLGVAALTSLPFLLHFSSFVSGIAVNCPPAILSDTRIGPIIFETIDKCQRSPIWMWWLLWGFFIYCGTWLLTIKKRHTLLTVFFFFSLALIIFPEFFYFKDIYPMHFRSNTMFKLGYQAFIMFSIVSAYAIVKLWRNKLFFLFLLPGLFLVSIYPVFSVRSYFNSLKHYEGISGIGWIARQYPSDWAAIVWLKKNAPKNSVIVEADGDSYTDYDRVSAFTGLPTIVGWPVHEWLWRGSYDVVAPRREEVRIVYESEDPEETREIFTKYSVDYVVVGTLEREKFTNISPEKFATLGTVVFSHGQTEIYAIH